MVSTRRSSAESPGLSNERILACATDLIDGEGAEAFTMRHLGGRLGVSAMALYRWYPNREALLDAVVERALRDLRLPVGDDGPWVDRAVTMATELRRHLVARRSLVSLPGAARRFTVALLRAADDGIALVREIVDEDADVVMVFRTIVWHTFSFVLVVDAWTAEADDAPASFRDAVAALGSDEAPLFSALAGHFGSVDSDALFAYSTRRLVEGLYAAAA
jgi:AcrR family transcriptional regulator